MEKLLTKLEGHKKKRVFLYANLLDAYPSRVQKYVLKNLVGVKTYYPDITLVLKSNKLKEDSQYLWVDLLSWHDAGLFIGHESFNRWFSFIKLTDVLIIGVDKKIPQGRCIWSSGWIN